jgi:hypothetical protein
MMHIAALVAPSTPSSLPAGHRTHVDAFLASE